MTIIKKYCSVCITKRIFKKDGYYIQITRRKDMARENGFICRKCYRKLEKIWGDEE